MAEFEIKEEWYPMPVQLGPPLPRSMQIYWPWVKPPAPPEIPEIPGIPLPPPPGVPPPAKYRLYVYTVGKGTVTPTDGEYPAGTTVTLTAKPEYGAAFDRWAGDAAGTSPIVSITMDRSKSATAYFKAITPPPYEEAPPPEEIPPVPPPPEEIPPVPPPPPTAPPKADIRNLDFVATEGTYDIGDRVPFTATYEYKGRAQGGQLVVSIGTGVYPAFIPVVNYSPMAVSFAEAMDWTPMSFSGTLLLTEALKPGQLYNTQAKLQTLDEPTQIIDTDWSVLTIREVAAPPAPPAPPAVAQFYMPAALNVREAGPYNGLYKVTFSIEITNRGNASGRYKLAWGSNYLTASPYLPGYGPWEEETSRIITIQPGETYYWSWTYEEVFDYYRGYFTCHLFGAWEGDNEAKGVWR